MFDYIEWRGDLSFAQSSFNEVDNLILCMLSCVDLSGIVPEPIGNRSISAAEAAAQYFSRSENADMRLGVLLPNEITPLFTKLAECKRFSSIMLSAYVNQIDDQVEKQFSAMTIALGDGTKYVVFRGTDDTIVGWKEDFNMSFSTHVPAQTDAVDYLQCVADSGPEALRVGGHSKGGNLAVYASMHSPPHVQARIIEVYNNDGPGFRESVIAQECYQNIRDKIKTFIPQSSIVGMLLEHEEAYRVVKSRGIGLWQHNGFTWEVLGTHFIHLDTVTNGCLYLDKTLKAWVDSLDTEQRRQFTEALFGILESTGAKTLTELTASKLKNAKIMINALKHLDKDTKDMLTRTIRLLLKEGARMSYMYINPYMQAK